MSTRKARWRWPIALAIAGLILLFLVQKGGLDGVALQLVQIVVPLVIFLLVRAWMVVHYVELQTERKERR